MRIIFLKALVLAVIIGIVYLIYPFLKVPAWMQYKAPIGTEKFCARYDVDSCPDECSIRPKSLVEPEMGCHETKKPKQ